MGRQLTGDDAAEHATLHRRSLPQAHDGLDPRET
jgi:hypothetical protein